MGLFIQGEKAIKANVWEIFQEILILFFPSMKSHIDPGGFVMCVEIKLRFQETHGQSALKLISPIQDHFLMSWVTTNCEFRFRGLKGI